MKSVHICIILTGYHALLLIFLKKKNILIYFLKKIMLIVVTRWKIDNYLLKISQLFQILLLFFQIPLMFCCSIDNLLLLKYATLCGVIFDIGILTNESPISQYWKSYSNILIIFSDFVKFHPKISSVSHFMPGTLI